MPSTSTRKSWKDNFLDRSCQPNVPVGRKLIYYITPGAGANADMLVLIDTALKIARATFPEFRKEDVQVYSIDKAKEEKLCRIGDHPFQFYTTWMKSEDYKLIWECHPTTKDLPDLPLKYPERNDLNLLRKKIHEENVERQVFRLQMPFRNIDNSQNDGFPSGSAEDMGKLFKPFVEFEKLHLVARSFEGPNIRNNKIIGTWACNGHMARAEYAIATVLQNKTGTKGTLAVSNEWKKARQIPRIHFSGKWTKEPRPDWFDDPTEVLEGHTPVQRHERVEQEKYMWLCVCLKYQWTMDDSCGLNLPINSYMYFDPFSCYIPLRVEAIVDIALGELLRRIPEGPDIAGSKTVSEWARSLMNDNPKEESASAQSTIYTGSTANASAPSTLNRQDSDVYSTADEFSDDYSTAPPSPNVENRTQFFESAKPFMKGYS